ncbi:polysaccharide biosynthesis C-terminal domain-containing protein [Zobellia laminariae]|uniref:polysaccharide biosynthesis C-terminal domain-containing protein n=1 Tax=Zobellia laminariae TaxID=248906 RepID=UPI0026F42397|nr:polysaccharide biosynthesis C-terminal domain-containing protein [Zobellia laminariae]WKX77477.1 polysaccharide biosynthesis C-terminal domain-containing protein [Zobellia laminariae]
MWYLFISGMLLNALWYTAEMVFRAVNEPRKMGLYGLIGAVVSVGLSYLLSRQFGLTGAAMGAISLDLILVVLVMPEGCKLMRMSLKELYTHGLEDLQTLGVQARHKLQSIRAKV